MFSSVCACSIARNLRSAVLTLIIHQHHRQHAGIGLAQNGGHTRCDTGGFIARRHDNRDRGPTRGVGRRRKIVELLRSPEVAPRRDQIDPYRKGKPGNGQ